MRSRLNITAAAFPLISTNLGGSAIIRIPQDNNYIITNNYTGSQADRDIGLPMHLYMHNVMPTTQGVKSISYTKQIPLAATEPVFDKIITLRDKDENKSFFAPARGRNFILGPTNPSSWQSFQFPALQNGLVTSAYVNGETYVAYKQQGLYRYDPIANNFFQVPLTGIVGSSIHGVCGANNYLIVWDSNTVYWSSAINALDFTPSLSTTSGSGRTQAARGAIVCCLPIHDGFVVYTTANAIVASFTGNYRFPWNFREIPGSGGVLDPEHVTYDTNYDSHFAWTTSGMLELNKQRAIPIWPEVSDFLTENYYEYAEGLELKQVYLTEKMRIKLAFLGARYVIVSYGPKTLEYALVYDIALRRWGKLKIPHVDWFPWVSPSYKYNELEARKSFGVLQSDGTIYTVNFDENAKASDSLYVFGHLRPVRGNTMVLHTVHTENSHPDLPFNLLVESTRDGKNVLQRTEPVKLSNGLVTEFKLRASGYSHKLIFTGTFNLNTLEIDYRIAGTR